MNAAARKAWTRAAMTIAMSTRMATTVSFGKEYRNLQIGMRIGSGHNRSAKNVEFPVAAIRAATVSERRYHRQ